MLKVIEKILNAFKKRVCSHEFRLSDMKLTGIPELEKPSNDDYAGWKKYYRDVFDHDSVTKRISLPCCKCGEMFYAQCGLDIISKGKVIPDKEKIIMKGN